MRLRIDVARPTWIGDGVDMISKLCTSSCQEQESMERLLTIL